MSLFNQMTESEVKALIEAGANVNARDNYNYAPLHRQSDEGVVRLLIEAGADVNARDIYNSTPLYYQTDEGVVRLLIKAGVDVNARNDFNSTPLHFQKDEGSVRLLIEAGADVTAKDDYNNTPLRYNSLVKKVVETMASEKITRFIRNCKWLKLYKLTRTFEFNKWYCGEEDGNGGGIGRKVDHKRIMDSIWVR